MASRTLNYALIAYPEGSQSDRIFGRILTEHIPAIVSPLHDNDLKEDGIFKKEHYHIILKFDSVKTAKQVLDIFADEGVSYVEPIKSIRAYTRYLIHFDDAEKYQYSKDDIVCLCGADYGEAFSLAKEAIEAIQVQISRFIIDYSITDYLTLVSWCCDQGATYHSVLARNSYHYLTLVKSNNKAV